MNLTAMLMDALKLIGAGFSMVFLVLAIFYGLVKGLLYVFPAKQEEEDD
jgi:hypothetical protein